MSKRVDRMAALIAVLAYFVGSAWRGLVVGGILAVVAWLSWPANEASTKAPKQPPAASAVAPMA